MKLDEVTVSNIYKQFQQFQICFKHLSSGEVKEVNKRQKGIANKAWIQSASRASHLTTWPFNPSNDIAFHLVCSQAN